jgi:putative holliday junction resolvase
MDTRYSENSTFLGFDFGTKNIGVAVGQNITKTATPLAIIDASKEKTLWQQIVKLIKAWHPSALIVGVPLNMDGTPQEMTKIARKFAQQLRELSGLSVCEVDERLTTKAAREEVYVHGGYKALQKAAIDSIAAQLILESWMHGKISI